MHAYKFKAILEFSCWADEMTDSGLLHSEGLKHSWTDKMVLMHNVNLAEATS